MAAQTLKADNMPKMNAIRNAVLLGLCWMAAPALARECQHEVKANAAQVSRYEQRDCDWRNGAVVYQVLVDRFVPSADLEAKRALYPPPKVLRDWSEPSMPGVYLPDAKLNSQELDFWGGDLKSMRTKLDYIRALGADAIYLNPIHLAYTNHKYDALDFQRISPEYGDRNDFKRLATDIHAKGMKVVLDGVFNHMGRNAPKFQEALNNPSSQWRHWFSIDPKFKGGALVWTGFQNLPELRLEYPPVRDYLYEGRDSVVRSYLRDGADGWRLDTAYELGYQYLRDLTQAAHREKPGSLVVGEIVQYPSDWLKSLDAVMNFTLRQIILGTVSGDIAPATTTRMTERMIADAGIEPMLKSWNLLDNHDLPRVANQLPDESARKLAQVLQFTLPGSPNVYYGAEVGMRGGPDPENRGPMRWDLVNDDNADLRWMKQLITMHKGERALRVGDFRRVEADRLLAFERYTDHVLETVLVLANPSSQEVSERVMVLNPALMDDTSLMNLLDPQTPFPVKTNSGFLNITLPPHGVLVLKPFERDFGGYSRYKRMP